MPQHSQDNSQLKQQHFNSDLTYCTIKLCGFPFPVTLQTSLTWTAVPSSHGCLYPTITQARLSGRLLHSEPHDDAEPLMRGSIGYACFYCPVERIVLIQCSGRPFAITTVWKHRKDKLPCRVQCCRYVQSSYSVQLDRQHI